MAFSAKIKIREIFQVLLDFFEVSAEFYKMMQKKEDKSKNWEIYVFYTAPAPS